MRTIPYEKKTSPSILTGIYFALLLFQVAFLNQQFAVDRLYHKAVCPETGTDIYLCISVGIFGAESDLKITALSAHTDSTVDVVGAIRQRQAQKFLVASFLPLPKKTICSRKTGSILTDRF